ncbi:MAG: hypothetical protein K2H76_04635 [Muribaculaceae bacterium]|nr:hypothetical protein [Muribaculaceae bacterium]
MNLLKYSIAMAFAASVMSASAKDADFAPVVSAMEMSRSEGAGAALNVAYTIDRSAWQLPSNTEVIVTPVVLFENDSVRLQPVILAGRNAYLAHKRNDDLPKGTDLVKAKGDALQRTAAIPWQKGMMKSELVFRTETRGCRCRNEGYATLPKTLAMNFTPERIETAPMAQTPAPEPRAVAKSAFVIYKLSSTDLLSDYADNRPELDLILATIDSIKSEGNVVVEEVTIHGYASPEGPYELNTRLAEGRAEALRRFVDEHYGFGNRIKTLSTPEDWTGLRQWVELSSLPEQKEILTVIDSDMEADAKENILKTRFPNAYAIMLKEVFPILRRADYSIRYRVNPPLPAAK